MIAASIAHPNIAMVKYWGKSDWSRNLPAVGSISVALAHLEMRTAIRRRDFEKVGTIAEHSALKLHGVLMAAQPGILYWNQGTVGAIQEIIQLRKSGIPVYFTIDAGFQVKAICLKSSESIVAERLRATTGVEEVFRSAPGPAAILLET